jgi:hypothetical protein
MDPAEKEEGSGGGAPLRAEIAVEVEVEVGVGVGVEVEVGVEVGVGVEPFAAVRSTAGKPVPSIRCAQYNISSPSLLVTGLAGGGALTISSLR